MRGILRGAGLAAALAMSIMAAAQQTPTPLICAQYFIPENGNKYVLTHDEDYCASISARTVPQNACVTG